MTPTAAASLDLAREVNPLTIAEQQQVIRQLARELRDARWKLRNAEKKLAEHDVSATLRAEVITWLIEDAEDLIITMPGERPIGLYSCLESPEKPVNTAWSRAKLFGRFLTAVLYGGSLYEMVRPCCRVCRESDCEGCGGASTDLDRVLPASVLRLMTGVRRG